MGSRGQGTALGPGSTQQGRTLGSGGCGGGRAGAGPGRGAPHSDPLLPRAAGPSWDLSDTPGGRGPARQAGKPAGGGRVGRDGHGGSLGEMRSPALHTPAPRPRPCFLVAWQPGQWGQQSLPRSGKAGGSLRARRGAGPQGRGGGHAGEVAPLAEEHLSPTSLAPEPAGRNGKGLGPARLWDPEMVCPRIQGAGRAHPPASCLRRLHAGCPRRTLGAREARARSGWGPWAAAACPQDTAAP